MAASPAWWQTGVIYQILVSSFNDSNGDGWGDLKGVIEKLDYIRWLGADAIWLSPIFASPLEDLGYDVSNYNDVERRFGTLDDLDALIAEAHRRDLKVILDWVPNHTSSQHPWFQESRASRDNPKRDWYLWRDGKPDGSPPNNWISVFGGSVWKRDDQTGQFYMHHFLASQPDLNWRNGDVQEAMLATLRFWMNLGVDGFRIDALDMLIKDEQFRDNPPNPNYNPSDGPDSSQIPLHTREQPMVHDMVARMRSTADEFPDRMLAGELYVPYDKVVKFYGGERPELHLPLNLKLCWSSWDSKTIKQLITEYYEQVGNRGWPTFTISMHDCPRIARRCKGEQTRLAAMLLLTLRGTPTHYYGEEVGMQGTPIPNEQARDPQGRRIGKNRDPERTPMQWCSHANAGFSTAEPWLPISEDLETANVSAQSDNPKSLLSLYRNLLRVRREEPALNVGEFEFIEVSDPLLAYRRTAGERKYEVVLNFGDSTQRYRVPKERKGRIVLSTFLDREEEVQGEVELRGTEGLLLTY